MILALAILGLLLSLLPTAMFLANLPLFCETLTGDDSESTEVSILVPARDEEAGIGACVEAALASEGVTIEVVVLDDDSSDDTPNIVKRLGDSDPRVRLIGSRPLPEGWNGKQHACWQLGSAASYEHLLFIDADVRLTPHAVAKLVSRKRDSEVGLLSAFPRQETGSWLEAWLIPMMHYILLGYLPFARMRSNADPSFAAGCGQLFLTTRDEYETAGTHEAIKASRHDGLKLPRAFRESGLTTDVIDGTELASCRMYCGFGEMVNGVLKNAVEGIANPRLIVPFSVLLLGASLLPLVALVSAWWTGNAIALVIATLALIIAHLPRFIAAVKLRQSRFGAACHIPATCCFVALQWLALTNHLLGRQVAWRGRVSS